MSRYQHGYSWQSLATPPNRPLLSADPQGYIPYWHRAAVCRFKLDVLPLLVHVPGSTWVHHSWARPYFSSSVPCVWFVLSVFGSTISSVFSLFLVFIVTAPFSMANLIPISLLYILIVRMRNFFILFLFR